MLSADGKVGDFGLTARSTRYGTVISPGSANPIADAASLTLLGPVAIREPPRGGWRAIPGQPILYPLFGLLPLRLQRTLPLRPRLGEVLGQSDIAGPASS